MPYLEVPEARLYYETVGSGPMLLCISGASGDADFWRDFAQCLKEHFTVVAYDRRGFSRSALTGAQDYEHRLQTDADDAAALIKHISKNEPATVLGNSAGAIVTLELLVRHPDAVRLVLPHEPPIHRLLPDYDELMTQQREIYDTYRRSGLPPAYAKFMDMTQMHEEFGAYLQAAAKENVYAFSNAQYWFERELLYYVTVDFDLDVLKRRGEKLLIVNGEGSKQEASQNRTNALIAKSIGQEVVFLPGGHLSFALMPREAARGVLEALRARDEFYRGL